MDEEHARVAPALGAYAAGALEPGEAAEVDAHLAGNGEATGPPAEAGPAAEALAAATADLDELLAGLSAEQWRLPVIHGWDVDGLLRHLAAAKPSAAAAGPDAALRQAFETWIHADDLRAALGRPPSPPAATVTAPATEFFYLMGNRRDPAAVASAVTGDRALAAGLLRAAATLGCD